MKAPAWSFSSLDTFVSCARKYHEEKVLKTVVQEETEAQRIGTETHKHFEDRLGPNKVPLPSHMLQHESYMLELEALGGVITTERKVGLTKELKPCDFFAPDVWWRGILDVHIKKPDGSVTIVDYKTGRPHNKMRQLHLFMVFCFAEGAPMAEAVFYWTKTMTKTPIRLPARQLGPILLGIVPDLNDYKEAFKLDLWPPKPNGLCQNYCGVTECEHFGKRMGGRG